VSTVSGVTAAISAVAAVGPWCEMLHAGRTSSSPAVVVRMRRMAISATAAVPGMAAKGAVPARRAVAPATAHAVALGISGRRRNHDRGQHADAEAHASEFGRHDYSSPGKTIGYTRP